MAKAEAKPKKPAEGMRSLTEAEIAEMQGDTDLPADYANTTLNDPAPAPAEPAAGDPAAEPQTPKDPPDSESPAADPALQPAAEPKPADISEDSFAKLERELAKPEGKEDLKSFSSREKAYFHQMRRDRKARQDAETERDRALFKLTKAQNPPPPPPDPFQGKADDDVMSVKEAREMLAKQPPAPAPTEAPAGPQVSPQAKRFLIMSEKEARANNPDFDVVMELADDLLSNDAIALREIGRSVAEEGANPAEEMYKAIKKHKDFATLLPVAETRHAAKKTAPQNQAPTPAPAAPPTPEEKAKIEQAKATERALENNNNKPKTTAHASAREGKPAEELTLDEIGTMSDLEFAKLPKKTRDSYLKRFGN